MAIAASQSSFMKLLYNPRLRQTLKKACPDLYKVKQKIEWHRQHNDTFKRLLNFVEKLNGNWSNQLANLSSSQELRPWAVDDELSGVVKSLKPEIYLTTPEAPTICTVALGSEYQAAVAPCIRGTKEYCERHQYNYLLLTQIPANFSRPSAWAKVCLLYYALEHDYHHIMWLDGDALITNVEVKLGNFIETLQQTEKSILITKDQNIINTGIFFLRGGWKSKILLNLVWCNRFYINHGWWEQAALMDLMRRHPEVANEEYIEQRPRNFNSRPLEIAKDPRVVWEPGDFIVHFAGARGAELVELAARFSELSVKPPP
jgi:glycosyl transferase family (putative galactosyltransferase)